MKIKLLGLFSLICLMASCTKTVKVETEAVSGQLEGAYKAAVGEYEAVKEGEDLILIIPIIRTEQTVPFTNETISVFSKDTKDVRTFAGFGFEMYDENGTKIGEVTPANNDYGKEHQLALLKLENNKTGELKIKLDKNKVPKSIKITTGLQFISTGEISMSGVIGKNEVKNCTLSMNIEQSTAEGAYQYSNSPAGSFYQLKGKVKKVDMEYGNFVFLLELSDDAFKSMGNFEFELPVKLTRDGATDPYRYVIYREIETPTEESFLYDLKSEAL